ncbi:MULTISPECIES: hypothetical protein [Enterobacterales]|nr:MULTISPECIES: hypothetical protein [Enterobacter]MBT1728016.1 hypothetical protein [Enterobacter quasimori]MBT1869912.1 hypothetical protein [Enterobacter mori]MBT1884189.1 hypothetical protein [Enterobacter mori]MBT2101939.1 hypothetical protein [Enterobacter mori]MBV7557641.1 hypothetical protein [Enterobacter sp. ENT02]
MNREETHCDVVKIQA